MTQSEGEGHDDGTEFGAFQYRALLDVRFDVRAKWFAERVLRNRSWQSGFAHPEELWPPKQGRTEDRRGEQYAREQILADGL